MTQKTVISISILFTFKLTLAASCNIDNIKKYAMNKYPEIGESNVFKYDSYLTTTYENFSLYYNKKINDSLAHRVEVTVDKESCKPLFIKAPTWSPVSFKRKPAKDNSCVDKGKIIADNHIFNVNKCTTGFKFIAYGNNSSRIFSNKEIDKIISIFKNADRSKLYNNQIVYNINGLKIWVRLYSEYQWFLVFDFDTPNVGGNVNAWIPSFKFYEFVSFLSK